MSLNFPAGIAESGFPYIGRDMEPARSAQRDSGQ